MSVQDYVVAHNPTGSETRAAAVTLSCNLYNADEVSDDCLLCNNVVQPTTGMNGLNRAKKSESADGFHITFFPFAGFFLTTRCYVPSVTNRGDILL